MKILLTGFGIFADNTENPSLEVLKYLSAQNESGELLSGIADGVEFDFVELPVEFQGARKKLQELGAYDFHLAMGLAANRVKPSFERFAMNVQDAKIPDNAGDYAHNRKITEGPLALETTLDLNKVVSDLTERGFDCYQSLSAGLYVCNTVLYTALETSHSAVFLHLPPVKEYDLQSQIDLVLEFLKTIILDNLQIDSVGQ